MNIMNTLLYGLAVLLQTSMVSAAQQCFYPVMADSTQYTTQICLDDTNAAVTSVTTGQAAVKPDVYGDLDTLWVFICAVLVFWMQAGFAMLEVGSVRSKNTANILMKNLMDACLGAISFWLLGYGFAYGDSNDGDFIGSANFGLEDETSDTNYVSWLFQWAFAATTATIVSGAVAERTSLKAYFIYTCVLTTFIYPVVVHWVWDTEGWLSAFKSSDRFGDNGMIDFAGSGVVHMVGGFAGLVGAAVVGKRIGCEPRANVTVEGAPQSPILCALGVAILWMGWYGFNCGSTLAASGGSIKLAAKVGVVTTISTAGSAIVGLFWGVLFRKTYDLMLILNCILAGLVSITAPCAVVEPWAALLIGMIGGLVYIGSSKLIKRMDIDDPLDAAAVHGFCGAWACISVGIFGEDQNVLKSYGYDNGAISSGQQLGVQVVGVICILVWTLGTSVIMFMAIKYIPGIGMRVAEVEEKAGLDISEHGLNCAVLATKGYSTALATKDMDTTEKAGEEKAGSGDIRPAAAVELAVV